MAPVRSVRRGDKVDPFDTARRNGMAAFYSGEPEASCPYDDVRKYDGRLTWSRAWCRAWLDGYREARRNAEAR